MPGDRNLSERKLGSEYRMIPPEESKEITGFESGTVHPFSTQLRHLVDERIFEKEEVSHTVGETKKAVIIDVEAFREALEESEFSYEIDDFAVSTEEDIREVREKGLEEASARFVVRNGYRKTFMDLSEDYSVDRVLDALKAFDREGLDLERIEDVLERADGQTHLQNLVEHLSTEGSLPEASDFDLEEVVEDVVEENPYAVRDFRDGQDSAVNFFIGQIMQRTNGKADAGKARELLLEELGDES